MADLDQLIKALHNTALQSNAEAAAKQEVAIVATANLAASRMDAINALAEDTFVSLKDLTSAIVGLLF